MSMPISILENMLHGDDYHNPEDLEKIAKLEAVVKSLRDKLEELVGKEEVQIQECSAKKRAKAKSKKESSVGRTKESDI